MATTFGDRLFGESWTTSKPGDMKNGGYLPTKFDKNPCGEIPLGKPTSCVLTPLPEPDSDHMSQSWVEPRHYSRPAVNHDKPTTDVDAW